MTRLLVATRNRKKLDELHRILVSIDLGAVELLTLADVPEYEEVPETGATFEENALLKAREGARHTGLVTVADDSGLAVDALNGMPGVLSARWSGGHGDDAANLDLLLAQISDVPAERRGAAFVCAAALVTPDGGEEVVVGRVDGTLTSEPRGDGGFGYDPIFVPTGHSRTTAEMPAEEKDQLSHRGRALRALAGPLTTALATSTGAN
ncbi:RdgB/HAM1 family non-canonical purine NTP pyrophosphatase [Fodinicola acaciae]|uniref:RdgB/HAM1 family non-canonical purine NTP pyrophosphatase n=1 Tax=Fodinicola acaciae TaxID=2681555 RepID=UPI0013CF5351|nr:RdgB/HAM1 family non-canonical purine NTP pyrophosphatase [Fodinicola acaciae]